MTGHARPRPKRLAEKLLQIRTVLGLSQSHLGKRLGIVDYTVISRFEHDKNEPSLMTLLAYARAVNIPLEQIVDDQLELTFNQSECLLH